MSAVQARGLTAAYLLAKQGYPSPSWKRIRLSAASPAPLATRITGSTSAATAFHQDLRGPVVMEELLGDELIDVPRLLAHSL